MKFLLSQYGDEKAMLAMPREEAGRIHGAYMQYTKALQDAGVYITNTGLRPTGDARTVRTAHGKLVVTDGPFAETKEQFGGFYLIDVPDADAAIEWAKKHPFTQFGAVEVRPVWG